MKKKFSAKEILTRDQMKKIAGSGYCSGLPCALGPQGSYCLFSVGGGGCKCTIQGYTFGPC